MECKFSNLYTCQAMPDGEYPEDPNICIACSLTRIALAMTVDARD